MDAVEKLLAIEEIRQLKARRVRCVDEKDWDGYAACHTPDVVSYAMPGAKADSPISGRETLTERLKATVSDRTTVHHLHSPEIEIISQTTAEGIWAMEDMLWWEENGQQHWLHGYGHYFETYEKLDGRWLIKSRKLTRIRVDQGVIGA